MSEVKSIKCTNCAAPLNLLGGGRVESITCSYCKSVLDLNNDYKVLSNFKSVKDIYKLPFEVGMKGTLEKIEYTIIGRITYAAVDYPHGEWTDFLLFSPLYGYAYLTYEEGHLIYSKRNRTFPNLTWLEIKESSPTYVDERAYFPFDEYDAKVVHVEGELTWIAKRGDKTSFIDLTAPPFGISAEKTKKEIEYYQSKYLKSDEVYEAFGIEKEEKPETFHALEPFEKPFFKLLSLIAFWVLVIVSLVFVTVYFDGKGTLIKSISADNTAVKSTDFTVKSNKYLVGLELQSQKAKSLNNFNLQIHKNHKIVFSLSPSAAYIFNEENGQVDKKLHPWEKEAKKVVIFLNLEEGKYHVSIKPIDMNLASNLSIKIKEKYVQKDYIIWFFVLTSFLWIIYKLMQWRYKYKMVNERTFLGENEFFDKGNLMGVIFVVIFFILLLNAES